MNISSESREPRKLPRKNHQNCNSRNVPIKKDYFQNKEKTYHHHCV